MGLSTTPPQAQVMDSKIVVPEMPSSEKEMMPPPPAHVNDAESVSSIQKHSVPYDNHSHRVFPPQYSSQRKRPTILLILPIILSIILSITLLATQAYIIQSLASHIWNGSVHYDVHSTRIHLETGPNDVMLSASVITLVFSALTTALIYILRHRTPTAASRLWLFRILVVFLASANLLIMIVAVATTFATQAKPQNQPFSVYLVETRGDIYSTTRETWLCSLQNRDGSGVGNVQQWGSIGCRLSKTGRYLSIVMMALAIFVVFIVWYVVLGNRKSGRVHRGIGETERGQSGSEIVSEMEGSEGKEKVAERYT